MPRKRRGFEETPPPRFPKLVRELADELRSDRVSGQPIIEEQRFPRTGAIRVTVIWDKWDRVVEEARSATILEAYEEVEGNEIRDRIGLAVGLTVPEAAESGILPFQILTAIRKDDPVTPEQCRKALIAEGASVLLNPDKPQLRFATLEEAEAGVRRLSERLPGSQLVWVIGQELSRIT